MTRYLEGFSKLASMLSRNSRLLKECEYFFLPEINDPSPSPLYPLPSLTDAFASRIAALIPRSHFLSNPCRLRYGFRADILLAKYDVVSKFALNSMFPPTTSLNEQGLPDPDQQFDIRDQVAKTILSQGHLLPASTRLVPQASGMDTALKIIPPPSIVKYNYHENIVP